MKKFRTRMFVCIMAFILLFSCISFTLVQNGKESYGNYYEPENGEPVFYYFCDYYPTIPIRAIEGKYPKYYDSTPIKSMEEDIDPKYRIAYERRPMVEGAFYELIQTEYFFRLRDDNYESFRPTVFVLDIKTFKPDITILSHFYDEIKDYYGCEMYFITTYDYNGELSSVFGDEGYYVDDFEELKDYFEIAFDHIGTDYGGYESMAYLIDSSLVFPAANYKNSLWELYLKLPFVKYLLIELSNRIGGPDISIYMDKRFTDEDIDVEDIENVPPEFDELKMKLIDEFHIKLLAYYKEDSFIDILTWQEYSFEQIEELFTNEDDEIQHVCALGFLHLNIAFYNILYYWQYEQGYDLHVYVMIADFVIFKDEGLGVDVCGR